MATDDRRFPHLPTRPPRWIEAAFRAGDRDGVYACGGAGGLVVALSRRADARFAQQCEVLAAAARVLVPVLPAERTDDCGRWLSGMVDVFAAGDVTIVADESALLDALVLALECGERVAAVHALDPTAGGDGVPVRLVPLIRARYIPG